VSNNGSHWYALLATSHGVFLAVLIAHGFVDISMLRFQFLPLPNSRLCLRLLSLSLYEALSQDAEASHIPAYKLHVIYSMQCWETSPMNQNMRWRSDRQPYLKCFGFCHRIRNVLFPQQVSGKCVSTNHLLV
jgi:hypothetical protein